MAQVSVEIRGTNRVRNQLRAIAAFHPNNTDSIIQKHARAQQKKLRNTPYPPYQPHFTHRRKRYFGGIAGSFSARRVSPGVWHIVNSRDYAQWVIGRPKNSHPSFAPWYDMRDELQGDMPQLTRQLSIELEQLMERA